MKKRRKTLSVYSEELERIARRDPLHPVTVKEKDLLMRLKEDCKTLHQTIIPRIIDCVNYKEYTEVKDLHNLLRAWPIIELQYALQLLDHKYPDERVHEYAVKCLSAAQVQDETIEMFMFQLVQALKHQNYHDSALCRFLMKRALNNQRLGHKFFWSLRCEISSDFSNLNLVLILEAYLLAAPAHLEILRAQRQFLLRLKSINDTLELQQSRNPDFAKRQEIFMENIKRFFVTPSTPDLDLISITDPTLRFNQIDLKNCALMKSKKKPQKIFFNNFDSVYQLEKRLENISFIFKIGDDLRQDCLILQILKIMDMLWKQNGKINNGIEIQLRQ